MADLLRLRDLRVGELRCFRRFRPGRWRLLSWTDCGWCGSAPLAPQDPDGGTYDGEPVVCPDCGEVGHVCADEAHCHVVWSDDEDGERLSPMALAAFRRLVGEPRADWWREVVRGD